MVGDLQSKSVIKMLLNKFVQFFEFVILIQIFFQINLLVLDKNVKKLVRLKLFIESILAFQIGSVGDVLYGYVTFIVIIGFMDIGRLFILSVGMDIKKKVRLY